MQNVKENRNDYIGGSDVPIIMGLSKFKSRWQLLKEKAGIEADDFQGNKYTEYGNIMEDKIREHLNEKAGRDYQENKVIDGVHRCHVDGYDKQYGEVIEIKTTSRKYENPSDFNDYAVQLLYYMKYFKAADGMLAIYNRPADFNEELDTDRLVFLNYSLEDPEDAALLESAEMAVQSFLEDLEKLKANPFLTENDLQPNEIQVLAHSVMRLESELVGFKELEAEHKKLKADLYLAMTTHDIKSWELPNGAKVTRIAQGEDKETTAFQEATFKKKHPELHQEFSKKQIKKGRVGYVKITLPKVAE